jgi:hypothetical protein
MFSKVRLFGERVRCWCTFTKSLDTSTYNRAALQRHWRPESENIMTHDVCESSPGSGNSRPISSSTINIGHDATLEKWLRATELEYH